MKNSPFALQKILQKYPLSAALCSSITADFAEENAMHETKRESKNWDRVLDPLRRQIATLRSGRNRWSVCPYRAPVFGPYLDCCLKVYKIIDDTRRFAELNGDASTIPVLAAQRGLVNNGLRWADWVPIKVKHAFEVEFERLYSVTLPDARAAAGADGPRSHFLGKRLIPFKTEFERSASAKRWLHLMLKLEIECAGREADPASAPVVGWMRDAIEIIKHRDRKREAPVQWHHLLPVEEQRKYEAWRGETLNGPDLDHALTVAHAEELRRAAMRREEFEAKQAQARAKAAVRQRARRAALKDTTV